MNHLLMIRWPCEEEFPTTALYPDYHSAFMALWGYAKDYWKTEWGSIPDDPEEAIEAYFDNAPERYTIRRLRMEA